jgi:SpoVK/Ycf46/Vps4 family AAA+-type ATPase
MIKNQSDDDELYEILNANPHVEVRSRESDAINNEPVPCTAPQSNYNFGGSPVQWATSNGSIFVPTSQTIPTLIPGFYEINSNPDIGIYFQKVPIKLDGILRFPDAVTDKVLKEIQAFWEKKAVFKKFNLLYKRGIILWGPQGSGKSTTLQLISKDVIEREGIVIKFDHPGLFSAGIRKLREIQPITPIVVLMEDIDAIIYNYNESSVINILDGVDKLENIVFVATTNYPEKLGDRIINRPSRFDKKHKVGFIGPEARKMYFEFLIGDTGVEIDLEKWVHDTKDFSIAHLKELFSAVIILGDEYEDAIKTLQTMKKRKSSDDDDERLGMRKN